MTFVVDRVMSATGSGSSSGSVTNAIAGGKMGKDEFVKLLVAQMQHQDPMNPQDGAQMAAQLAQFSSVEQLININDTLAAQGGSNAALATSLENASAIGLIGKRVSIASNTVKVGGGTVPPYITELPKTGRVTVSLVDESGKVVRQDDLGRLGAGRHALDIGGLASGLPAGTYTIKLSSTNIDGTVTSPASFTTARVDGVQFGPTGLVLRSGNQTYPITGVTSVDADT